MEVCQTANKHLIRSAKERREKKKERKKRPLECSFLALPCFSVCRCPCGCVSLSQPTAKGEFPHKRHSARMKGSTHLMLCQLQLYINIAIHLLSYTLIKILIQKTRHIKCQHLTNVIHNII